MKTLIRFVCGLRNHQGAKWLADESGEFVVQDCHRCRTVIIQSLADHHEVEDFKAVLDRWLVDWRPDGDPL